MPLAIDAANISRALLRWSSISSFEIPIFRSSWSLISRKRSSSSAISTSIVVLKVWTFSGECRNVVINESLYWGSMIISLVYPLSYKTSYWSVSNKPRADVAGMETNNMTHERSRQNTSLNFFITTRSFLDIVLPTSIVWSSWITIIGPDKIKIRFVFRPKHFLALDTGTWMYNFILSSFP